MAATPDEAGFVKRGLLLLAAMLALGAAVLTMVLYRPNVAEPVVYANLPAKESEPGWLIRYNAAAALARRGSADVPWKVLDEMLDEKQQLKNFPVKLSDGKTVSDEAAARATVITALKALGEWHKKSPASPAPAGFLALRDRVEALSKSTYPELKAQAESLRTAFAN